MACTSTIPVDFLRAGFRLAVGLAAWLLAGGCVTIDARAAWPVFRGDPSLSGTASGSLPDKLRLRWTFQAGDAVKASPVADDRAVYAGSLGGRLVAIDRETGLSLWSAELGDGIEAAPLLFRGAVFVGTLEGRIAAFDAGSGRRIWVSDKVGKVAGSVNILSGPGSNEASIVAGTYDHSIYCLSAATGRTNWVYATGSYVNGTPAVWDGKVVAGGCDARLHVVSAWNGQPVLTLPAGSYVAGSVAVAGGQGFFGTYGGEVLGMDLGSGSPLWRYDSEPRGEPFLSSPAVDGDRVVVGGRDRKVHCVARADGRSLWRFEAGGEVDGSPVICGDKVVIGTGGGTLLMLRLADGEPVWSYEIGSRIDGSPAVDRGLVAVGAEDGRVYAFDGGVDEGRARGEGGSP